MWARVTPDGEGYTFEEVEHISGGAFQAKPHGRTGNACEANGQAVPASRIVRLYEEGCVFVFHARV